MNAICNMANLSYLAKLQYKADKITESLKDERATAGFPRICLENKIFALKADIRSLEYKYDQILAPNFPICRPSLKNRRVSLPAGVSLFLPSFEFDGSDEKKLIKRSTDWKIGCKDLIVFIF